MTDETEILVAQARLNMIAREILRERDAPAGVNIEVMAALYAEAEGLSLRVVTLHDQLVQELTRRQDLQEKALEDHRRAIEKLEVDRTLTLWQGVLAGEYQTQN